MKKITSLVLILCMCVGLFTVCPAAAPAYLYACVEDAEDVEIDFEFVAVLTLSNPSGAETEYRCAARTTINGVTYDDAYLMAQDIPLGSFIRFALNAEGEIYTIDYDEACATYEAVSYDPATKSFVGIEEDITGLPVYKNWSYPEEPDEKHTYYVQVYKYAVKLVDYSAKNGMGTIRNIETTSALNADFEQTVKVYFEPDHYEEEMDFYVMLRVLDADNTVLQEDAYISYSSRITLNSLPNKTASYTVELWLENEAETIVSPLYSIPLVTEEIPSFHGYAAESVVVTGAFNEKDLQLKILDKFGKEAVFDCASKVTIDGTVYRDAAAAAKSITVPCFIQFTLNINGEIDVIKCGTILKSYIGVGYDPATKSFVGVEEDTAGLPVYYIGKTVLPICPDANHTYDIEVHDCAIKVLDYRAKNGMKTIKGISVESGLVSTSFKQCIDVTYETENQSDSVTVQLYDENNVLLEEMTAKEGCAFSSELPNITDTYLIKLWQENASGTRISPIYMLEHQIEEASVFYGTIEATAIEGNGYGEFLLFKIVLPNGEEPVFACDSKTWIEGCRYADVVNMQDALPVGTFVKFAAKGENALIVETKEVEKSGNCGDAAAWVLDDDGLLTIYGSGAMADYTVDDPAPWQAFDYVEAEVTKGITTIGDYAFNGSDSLAFIFLPCGIKEIGSEAFFDCTALETFYLKDILLSHPPVIVVAGYAGNKLLESKRIDIEVDGGILHSAFNVAEADSCKAFIWESLSNVTPMCVSTQIAP